MSDTSKSARIALRNASAIAFAGILALLIAPSPPVARTAETLPLELEAKIPLGSVKGRIDHMAFDGSRSRLFVAELGNDSVGIVDLKDRKVAHVIAGMKEPQGVGYAAATDTLYVADGGDGSVRLFEAGSGAPAGRIDLGDDADNIRIDPAANQVYVGYGNGGLAIIDPGSRRKLADIRLEAHPESFQLAADRIFVNLPSRRQIAVVDRAAGKQIATWPMNSGGNFPMALDPDGKRLLVAFRSPPRLGIFSIEDGASVASVETCGDSDDVFLDSKRHRVYVSCGEGFLDVFDSDSPYRRLEHMPTASGARTSFFSTEMDRLLLAVRATAGEPAAIWIFRPNS